MILWEDDIELDGDLTMMTGQVKSLVSGVAPFAVASSIMVASLNVDMLDDQHGPFYLDHANMTGRAGWGQLPQVSPGLVGRYDAGVGNMQPITLGTGLNMTAGGVLNGTEGTVYDVGVSNLAGALIGASVSSPSTSPTINLSISNASANTWWGNASASSGVPSYNSLGSLSRVNDENVTLTLGGTPASALAKPVSMTLGWSGQLSVPRGGTGADTITGIAVGNGAAAFTGVAGAAGQLLRRSLAGTAYEFFSPDYISNTLIGQPSGIAPLDGSGKVPSSFLPTTGMQYMGTWNADTNTPALSDATGVDGQYYRVEVGGTVNLGSGPITFTVGDDAIHNGSVWQRAPAGTTATNLGIGVRTSTALPITNSNGTGVELPLATVSLAGLISATDYTKLQNSLTAETDPIWTAFRPRVVYGDNATGTANWTTDVDDVEKSGFYYVQGGNNRPSNENSHLLQAQHPSGNYWMQIASPFTVGGKLYYRKNNNGSIGAWRALADEDWVVGNTRSNTWVPTWEQVTGKPSTFAPAAHTLDSHSNVSISSPSNGQLLRYDAGSWQNWTPDYITSAALPTNYVTSNTTQAGLTGHKTWTNTHTWQPSGSQAAISNSIAIGVGGNGAWIAGRDADAADAWVLGNYAVSGFQLQLNKGGVSTPDHGTSANWFQAYNWGSPLSYGFVTEAAADARYVRINAGNVIIGAHNFTSSTLRLPNHFFHNLLSNEVYTHFYDNVAGDASTANFRVRNGSGGFLTLRFGGNGAFTWQGQNVAMQPWTTSNFAGINHTHATLIRGAGLTGGNYNGSTGQAWGADFGTGSDQVARGNHTHATLTPGTGLNGDTYNGGAARTFSVAYGTSAGTAAQGNDSRIVNAVPNSRQVNTRWSISGGGQLNNDKMLNLAGDVENPGANKLYGTSGSGVRGWYDQPSGGGGNVTGGGASGYYAAWNSGSNITYGILRHYEVSGVAAVGVNGTSSNPSHRFYVNGASYFSGDIIGAGQINVATNAHVDGRVNGWGGVKAGNLNPLDASAILQADSTNKGFAPPRMTASQFENISNKMQGLMAYMTDADAISWRGNGANNQPPAIRYNPSTGKYQGYNYVFEEWQNFN